MLKKSEGQEDKYVEEVASIIRVSGEVPLKIYLRKDIKDVRGWATGPVEEKSQEREAGNIQDPPGASSEGRKGVYLDQKVQLRSQREAWSELWALKIRMLAFILNKMRSQEGL